MRRRSGAGQRHMQSQQALQWQLQTCTFASLWGGVSRAAPIARFCNPTRPQGNAPGSVHVRCFFAALAAAALLPQNDTQPTSITPLLCAPAQGTHVTKTRSQVRGGGRKPRPQKGSGQSRQGTIRAPQWRGGGTAHGPVLRSHAHKLYKRVRRLGLKCALSVSLLRCAARAVLRVLCCACCAGRQAQPCGSASELGGLCNLMEC